MKIRSGFVSNSSSSSFVAIMVSEYSHPTVFKNILKALGFSKKPGYEDVRLLGWRDADYGIYEKHGINLYVSSCEVYAVGIDAVQAIVSDKRLSEIKQHFIEQLEKLGINIDKKYIEFQYGEIESG